MTLTTCFLSLYSLTVCDGLIPVRVVITHLTTAPTSSRTDVWSSGPFQHMSFGQLVHWTLGCRAPWRSTRCHLGGARSDPFHHPRTAPAPHQRLTSTASSTPTSTPTSTPHLTPHLSSQQGRRHTRTRCLFGSLTLSRLSPSAVLQCVCSCCN